MESVIIRISGIMCMKLESCKTPQNLKHLSFNNNKKKFLKLMQKTKRNKPSILITQKSNGIKKKKKQVKF